jgi:Uma2 family endonuclease
MIRQTPKFENVKSADQLYELPDDGNRYELIKGDLIMMSPAGSEHGWIAGRIFVRLATHVENLDLGRAYAAETGFKISESPDTVRAPDACFVSHERLNTVVETRSYLPLAPDLVVEVVSPNDTSTDVEAKAEQWLEAGSRVVLVADPGNQTLRVYKSKAQIEVFHSGEEFSSGDVCDDWKISVNEIFDIQD